MFEYRWMSENMYEYVCVCVYVCDRLHINSIFIHLRVVVKSYNTTNVTHVIQQPTKQKTAND